MPAMDIKTIRKMNVRILESEVGSLTALARLAGTTQSYLSQCVGKGAFRAVGDDMARRLEFGTKKPHGWMDESHIDEAHLMVARQIYDKLLELPRAKLDALVELLDMVDSTEREGFLGHINLDENSDETTKGRVITLTDNESSEKKQRSPSVPKRNHK
jgi:hypothetical protein